MVNKILALLLFFFSLSAFAQSNKIQSINATQQGGDIVLRLDFSSPLDALPAAFAVNLPPKIALDFEKTANGLEKNSLQGNIGDFLGFNAVQVGDKTRVVLNTVKSMAYTMRLDGKSLYVSLTQPVQSLVNTASGMKYTRFEETPLRGKHTIQDIKFRRGKDGEGRIIVDLSDSGAGIDVKQQGGRLNVDFIKTDISANLLRKLDVVDFGTPVQFVETTSQNGVVKLTLSATAPWEHNAYQSENQFIIEVKKIVEDPNKLTQGTKIGYQGPRVSINYQNGDIRSLLRLMAEELNLNAVISESVSGTTTLVLKDVPADQVVDIIFQQKGLDMRKNGNVILIAPRDEIATREKLEFESRQQITELEPTKTEIFQINYHKAQSIFDFLKNKDQTILSKRGAVIVDTRSNKLFVTDISAKLAEVRKVLSEIDIPSRQVMIEARIVEATDSFSRNLGVRLGFNGSKTNSAGTGVRVGGQLNDTGMLTSSQGTTLVSGTPTLSNTQFVNLPATPRSGTAGAMSFILYGSGLSEFLTLELSALEADGRGKVISSPRVLTADQVEALIEQGVEIPYQQATSSGATSVSFRKANLALKVKPQITPDGKITLTLDVNKDTPNSTLQTGSGVAIDTKHIKTEVLVDNGGTVVIGGIYTLSNKKQVQKIPVLGDLPYLGALFRNSEVIDDKTELLIFVTPKIVSEKLGVN